MLRTTPHFGALAIRFEGDQGGRARACRMNSPIERIGDAHGRIALYLDKQGAIDLAETFGRSDSAYDELMRAVSRAYPEIEDDQ